MQLLIATQNEGKVREFRRALTGTAPFVELLSAKDAGLTEFPPEVGSSYTQNAAVKAVYAAEQTGLYSLGDDSGLEVEALDGAPGLYSARFGGELSNEERLTYLLGKLEDVPDKARDARFVCALVLATPQGERHTFWGECQGEITRSATGAGGFGYDPVFYSHDLQKTFAEASSEEKEHVSHRGRAVAQLGEWLKEEERLKKKD